MSGENSQTGNQPVVHTNVGDVTPADLATYRQDAALAELLGGEDNRFQQGARHDIIPRGMFSETAAPPEIVPQMPVQPDFTGQPQPGPDDAFWRQRYGQSENEKGEWRRVAQSYESQFTQLQTQLADLNARVVAQQIAPQQAYYGPPSAPPAPPQPYNLFPQRAPDEPLSVGEFNDALTRFAYSEVVPALRDVRSQAATEGYQRAMTDAQRRFGGWDVTPVEEANVRSKFPWLATIAPSDANQFILEHARALRPQQPTQMSPVTRPQPTIVGHVSGQQVSQPAHQPVMVDPRTVMRRATYIESAPPAQVTVEPGNQLPPSEAFKQEVAALDAQAKAKGLPRASAGEYRAAMSKHFPNMPQGGDGPAQIMFER